LVLSATHEAALLHVSLAELQHHAWQPTSDDSNPANG
jgi:hypothetical protein